MAYTRCKVGDSILLAGLKELTLCYKQIIILLIIITTTIIIILIMLFLVYLVDVYNLVKKIYRI